MPEQPLLAEETYGILHRLLDKSDAGRMRLNLKCSAKETPELYDFDDQSQVSVVWDDLKQLQRLGVLELKLKRQKRGYNEYDDGRIDLKYEAEETVRLWLERPAFDPQLHLWSVAVSKYQSSFEDGGVALQREALTFPGRSYRQIAAGFARIGETLQTPQTLRQLSARCFWGESKFLDRRESLVVATYPSLARNIVARPLLLSVYLPHDLEQILFVENQDTFLQMMGTKPARWGLVYMGGFRGTALRVREPGQAVFSYVNATADEQRDLFEQFWLGGAQLPCYFWGDLDYAGLSILAALKQVFPAVEAWQPGYQPLVEILQMERGHNMNAGGKERQHKPGVIDCRYADYVLLPAIEEHQSFVDQEAVDVRDVLKDIL